MNTEHTVVAHSDRLHISKPSMKLDYAMAVNIAHPIYGNVLYKITAISVQSQQSRK